MLNKFEIQEFLKNKFKNHSQKESYYINQLPKITSFYWSTEPQFYLGLFKIERGRLPKGKILKEEPLKKANCVKSSYDELDRLILQEKWRGSYYRKYFVYFENTILTYTFSKKDTLEEIEYQELSNNIPQNYGCYHKEFVANTYDEYFYKNGKLEFIKSLWVYYQTIQEPTYHFEFDVFENLKSIIRKDKISESFPEGQNSSIYKKTKYSLKSLTDIFLNELNNEIIKKYGQIDKKFILIILQDALNSDEWLPFNIAVVDIKPMNEIIMHDFIDFDWLDVDTISSTKIQQISELVMQEIELKGKHDIPFKLLIKLCKTLKSNIERSNFILPLDFPKDYYVTNFSIINRLYSKKDFLHLLDK